MNIKTTTIISILLCLFFSMKGFTQKLSNVQEVSLRMPEGMKIDGKAMEWNDQFQAYNKATGVFYSLANNDSTLYLIVKADKPRIIEKLFDVGLTFIVNTDGKKDDQGSGNKVINYPVLDFASSERIIWYAGAKVRSGVALPAGMGERDTVKYSDTHTDSLIAIANKLFEERSKTIKTKGINGIPDNVLSVYNEKRVKVAGRFDQSGKYIYELSIPLKMLDLTVDAPKKFSYSIHLESRITNPKHGMVIRYIYPNHIVTDVDQDLDSTTDLWGYYTLSTK